MQMRTIRRTAIALVGASVLIATTAVPSGAGAQPGAQVGRRTLNGSTPSWARPSRDVGAASGAKPVTITVSLALRDPQGAAAFVDQVSNPASASYAHYITPDEFAARFEATKADMSKVSRFLTDSGLTIESADTMNIVANGSLSAAASAFGATIHRYAYRGKVLDAPTADLTIPSALADKIFAVSGLDQAGALTHPLKDTTGQTAAPNAAPTTPAGHAGQAAPPPDTFVNAPPCSMYFGETVATQYPKVNGHSVPFAPCGYTPAQFRGAYNTAPLIAQGVTGKHVTVAITDAYAAPTILQDANEFSSRHGLPLMGSSQYSQIVPSSFRYGYGDPQFGDLCGERGWYGEETLDVEAVHAMAPDANILYVAGRSCVDPDLLNALNKIVSKHQADIITNSWGDTGEDVSSGTLNAYHQLFTKAASEGIGVYFSSGDDGDDSGDTTDGSPAADFPATDPLVTAVGGTTLGVGDGKKYSFETGWATGTSTLSKDGKKWDPAYPGDFLYGGGGGVSSLFAAPSYQQGVVPNRIAGGRRALPDIAMDGDPQTGMLIGETQRFPDHSMRYSEYRIGGTSLSSPLFAGLMALADQAAGHAHGFANPAIYALAGSSALHDVRNPSPVPAVVRVNFNNDVDDSDGTTVLLRSLGDEAQTLRVTPGWDDLTGVGTPRGTNFVAGLG